MDFHFFFAFRNDQHKREYLENLIKAIEIRRKWNIIQKPKLASNKNKPISVRIVERVTNDNCPVACG